LWQIQVEKIGPRYLYTLISSTGVDRGGPGVNYMNLIWPDFMEMTKSGANPTIVSASAVKKYNANSSLVRFENKNVFFYLEKCSR
jgi:hypothetical protein